MSDVAVLLEDAAPKTGSLLPHFVSVFTSGYHLGFDLGRSAGREQVFRRLDECLAVVPLRQLDGADIFAALGEQQRSEQLRRRIDSAREQWWKREEMGLEREAIRLQELRAEQARCDAQARADLDQATPEVQRQAALRLRAAFHNDTWSVPVTWQDLSLSEAQAWARTVSEVCP